MVPRFPPVGQWVREEWAREGEEGGLDCADLPWDGVGGVGHGHLESQGPLRGSGQMLANI